jgi:hypothetical protein
MDTELEESPYYKLADDSTAPPSVDPQRQWYARNSLIAAFAGELQPDRFRRIRVEDFVKEPRRELRELLDWIGPGAAHCSIETMLSLGNWPFAHLGPWNARLGGDFEFLRKPSSLPAPGHDFRLTVELPWRHDGSGFNPDVLRLATEFGYD